MTRSKEKINTEKEGQFAPGLYFHLTADRSEWLDRFFAFSSWLGQIKSPEMEIEESKTWLPPQMLIPWRQDFYFVSTYTSSTSSTQLILNQY